ncbi:hypothetical protein [Sinomonas cyclohexanicum]|uniref:hypothetical protein n=1 Tax=Sinomonas cyclohexanicum TaxID=322009 RepID=UPI0035304A10
MALAHALHGHTSLTVTAPALNTVQELSDSPGIQVDCLGGRLRSVSQTFVGPLAEAALERMTFDRVFLGADAVTARPASLPRVGTPATSLDAGHRRQRGPRSGRALPTCGHAGPNRTGRARGPSWRSPPRRSGLTSGLVPVLMRF